MRTFFAVVFDDIVQNTTDVYTEAAHNGLLGSADRMSFQVISNVFTGGPSLTVAVQHSADGRTWQPRSSVPEIDRDLLNWTDTNNHVVFYDTAASVGCLVRLRIALGGSATVRVKITACGRSRYRPPAPVTGIDIEAHVEADPFMTDADLLDPEDCRGLSLFSATFRSHNRMVQDARTALRQDAWDRRFGPPRLAAAEPSGGCLDGAREPALRECGCGKG